MTIEDVTADTNYFIFDEEPIPYYGLKNDGKTSRGLMIGDSYERLIELYGEPHKCVDSWVFYYSQGGFQAASNSEYCISI